MLKWFVLYVGLVAAQPWAPVMQSCEDEPLRSYPMCDYSLSYAERAQDLVQRMTLEERIDQMGVLAFANHRLGVHKFQYWSEALHGVAWSPGVTFYGSIHAATCFPQVINMGATFDIELVRETTRIVSTEARAMANVGQADTVYFTPNINIFRDPRWGRGQETPGEDPYWTSEYTVALVESLQEDPLDPNHLKTAATCKHFTAYDLESWEGVDRYHFDAIVSDRDMEETYQPPFEACVKRAHVESIMCSYNRVNGVPMCANGYLQNEVLRGEWGFDGYIVSDCGAIYWVYAGHNYTESFTEAVAASIVGGTDIDCGRGSYATEDPTAYERLAYDAIQAGYSGITEDHVTTAVTRLFKTRMALGEWDPPETQPFRQITRDQVDTPEARALALRAARESMVLLQNTNNVLPLSASLLDTVAVIGPHAVATHVLKANYYGEAPYLITPVEGIGEYVPATFAKGCDIVGDDRSGFQLAAEAARSADAVVVVLGLHPENFEGEFDDRTSLDMPGVQWELLDIVKMNARGPVILVTINGGPIDYTPAKHVADAIIWAGYPGQEGGRAIGDVIFGTYNPSGRLPYTVYPTIYTQQVGMFDMEMRRPPGRTYKFYTGDTVYEFGHGLSYTEFEYSYSKSTFPTTLSTKDLMHNEHRVFITVRNVGNVFGEASVLAFSSSNVPEAPIRELFGIERVALQPGEEITIEFPTTERTFSSVNGVGQRWILPQKVKMLIGKQIVHELTIGGPEVMLLK